jgi:hypothetical protein
MLSSTIKRSLLTPRSTRILKPSVRWATQDYGSGKGDPKGEKPQDQGANPSADLEHPGAPPPKEGEGSGGSPTKGTSTGHNTGESKQAQAQKRQFSTVRTLWSKDRPKSTEGLKPKILDESAPAKHEQGEDAKKHNEEMEQRTDRAHEQVDADNKKDKVDSEFWSGKFFVL